MNVLDEIRNDAAGAALLADWLGEGGEPVDIRLAEWRSSTCAAGNLSQPCQFNIEPKWWERMKNSVAETIRKQLEIKNKIKLRTSRDDSIFMCQRCGCALPLKVHVPLKHIREHTRPELIDKLPWWCWIKRELSYENGSAEKVS
jgi:hypothetical protein